MNILNNTILSTDSYKFSHYKQYPAGATDVFSYIEARGSNLPGCNETVFFGLQSYIKDVLMSPITKQDVEFAEKFTAAHGVPFNKEGWLRIVEVHKGMLPVKIDAVPEGTVVPTGNLLLSIHCNDPELFWLPSYLETAILRAVWYGTSVASISRHVKSVIKSYLDKTSDAPDAELPFKLHDFGARGVSSTQSAGIGGAAHLVNFMGSDTVEGILHSMQYYNADVCGFSIPAAEHSTMTSWGRENEESAYENMVEQYARKGSIFAVVSDSYDVYNAVEKIWANNLLTRVKLRGATAVIRPDSGDPLVVPIELIELLMKEVGYTVNSKGYKVLPDYVRLIQGDGCTPETIEAILAKMESKGLSASNIAFGMGAGLLQKCDRDTFKMAMKCSAVEINGKFVDVYKDPVTDPGKKSKKGVLTLLHRNGKYLTVRAEEADKMRKDGWYLATRCVFNSVHGRVDQIEMYNFNEIRERAKL